MTLSAKPVQMLLAVVIAVVVDPPLGAVAAFLGGFGMYAADGYPWSLGPAGLASGARMLLALIVVAYIFATPIALAGGILVALWIWWRPPNFAVVLVAAAIVSIGYWCLHGIDYILRRDSLVTVAAALISATGCWFLTRRFARNA